MADVYRICSRCLFCVFFFYPGTTESSGSVSEKPTSLSKNRPLSCCCMLSFSPIFRPYEWRNLKAFIPAGNQPEIFLCQFSPIPQFRRALSPTEAHNEGFVLFFFVHFWHFFFACSLSFRQHAAYANTRSFILKTPPLNECNPLNEDAQLQRGHGNAHTERLVVAHALPDTQSLRRQRHQTHHTELSVQALRAHGQQEGENECEGLGHSLCAAGNLL